MKTTGQFEIHRFPIPFSKFNDEIKLIPFGDIHRSAPLCHEEKWQEFLAMARNHKNAYFIGMGDYDDLMSTSERAACSKADYHDSTLQTLETLYKKQTDRLVKELSFMKGRLIGLLEGNHFMQFQNGTTSTQRMCDALECKYLGCSAFVRLSFQCATRGGTHALDIWAHHGMGAARLAGGSLNRVQNMAEAAEADIYLMGHDHKRGALPLNRLKLVGSGASLALANRKIYIARTGSFLRGYVPGAVSYIADGAMNPCDLGVVVFTLTPRRHKSSGEDTVEIDITASV
jgi:hypothetical protein